MVKIATASVVFNNLVEFTIKQRENLIDKCLFLCNASKGSKLALGSGRLEIAPTSVLLINTRV